MAQKNRSSVGNSQGILSTLLALLAFAGMVFWGCTQKDSELNDNPNSQGECEIGDVSCEPPPLSSDAQTPISSPQEPSSDSQTPEPGASSGASSSSVSGAGVSSSDGISSSSHTPEVTDPGAYCAYQPTWCNNIPFENVKKESMDAVDVGATDKGQERPNCIYATAIIQIGNESGGISINGKQFANGFDSRCGGGEWGDATACATKFASVAKVDGGYYIYIPKWAGQNFKTTGGQPVCPSTPVTGSSSSKTGSSSSAGSATGACVEPMNGLPPNGTKSCIKVGSKCYTCNPDRGTDCSQGWIWQGGNVSDQYWYKEVSCTENGGGGTTYNLTCTGLATTGIAGTAVTQPVVKCNGDNATATFSGAPNSWTAPTAGTYNVSAMANCGGNKTVSCGTLTITAPSTDQLTCTGLAQTGIAGTAITQPTVKCGSTTVTNGTWTGAPTWTNPTANTYTVSVAATCGGSSKTATCGTLKVSPKLTCGNPSPASVTAGTAVTAPAVTCGTTTVATANISWSGQPTYWSSPEAGTYSSIKATVNSGDCSGQTATCGTLTVGNKLTCGNIAQTITVGQTPTKAANLVTCGSTNVTTGITWNPTSVGGAINTAQTINTITATASCGGSNQTATCTGSIIVNAQQTTPSSSSAGGGGSSYVPKTPGTKTLKTTQYWDACKPSCGWSGKGGLRASSCNISGGGKAKNDDKSACDGGSSFTCMDQAPRKVGNVSFGYAAINDQDGQCGDCFQLDFPNGQVMVVMKSNIGNLNDGAKMDLMIPGGGAGDFDALTKQVQNSGISNPDMGQRYGGFRLACNNSASCVKQKCDATFKNLPDLRAGCNWYADNLGTDNASFDNPTVKYQKVDCPKELTDRY